MRKQRFMDMSTLVCPVCNKTFPIMRNHGQQRKKGHVKDIWCPYCGGVKKFKEIRRSDYMETGNSVIYM